jgi:hypothetical protein
MNDVTSEYRFVIKFAMEVPKTELTVVFRIAWRLAYWLNLATLSGLKDLRFGFAMIASSFFTLGSGYRT